MFARSLAPLLASLIPLHADVIIDAATGNGGFVNASAGFNGSPDGWAAQNGVWIIDTGSSLTTAPFGADSATNSRAIQIHKDAGETLTSTIALSVQAGDTVTLNFDCKTGGSGNNTTLTALLWDPTTNAAFATFGSLSTSNALSSFVQKTYTVTAPSAAAALKLRFTLTSAGGTGKDFHLDRVHLDGGVVVPPPPPTPIIYDTQQTLVDGDTTERIIEKAAKTLPHARQVTWQRMEQTYFIHFGVNTFNGREWGTGYENPAIFNPTALDAAQWVREIKQAGGKQVMLVAKHHDGFCLWPSRYTAQDVASSPRPDLDVVRAVSDACQAQGVKLGVYLSPADLYQIHADETAGNPEGYYGNGSAVQTSTIPTDPASFKASPTTGRAPAADFGPYTYQVNDYNRYFLNQLYEILTEYGAISQVWFDGANPEAGISETHDYAKWYDLIRKLRPDIVIGIGGDDARWVGNESGTARATEWSVIPKPMGDHGAADLGSRSKLVIGSTLSWFPAEADVPILNGWFWSSAKTPKSTSSLLGIYYTSVGRNANLLLNLSPDNRGLIPDNQLNSLRPFGQIVRNTFAVNQAAGAAVTVNSNSSSGGNLANDGDLDTFWEAAEGASTAELILDLPVAKTFDVISLQEPIALRGQRIEGFSVDTWDGSAWTNRTTGTTVGHKRLLKLGSPVTTSRVRFSITASRLNPSLAEVGLYKEAVTINAPVISGRDAQGRVTITGQSGLNIRYTLDGSAPTLSSALYSGAIDLQMGGTVTAASFGSDGLPGIFASSAFPNNAPIGWTAPVGAADDNSTTVWSSNGLPQSLTVDMGSAKSISGFTYLPPSGGGSGTLVGYQFHTSEDGTSWTMRASGSFQNIVNNPILQQVDFAPCMARHIRLTGLSETTANNTMKVAELGVVPAGFDAWRRDMGIPASPATSDADGDGRPLWQEYAQLTSPSTPDTCNPATIEWQAGSAQPGLIIHRDPNRFDVICELQAASDLAESSWQVVPEISEVVSTAADGTQNVRFKEASPPAVADRRFYRIRYRAK